jgi:hypothetical protein
VDSNDFILTDDRGAALSVEGADSIAYFSSGVDILYPIWFGESILIQFYLGFLLIVRGVIGQAVIYRIAEDA